MHQTGWRACSLTGFFESLALLLCSLARMPAARPVPPSPSPSLFVSSLHLGGETFQRARLEAVQGAKFGGADKVLAGLPEARGSL